MADCEGENGQAFYSSLVTAFCVVYWLNCASMIVVLVLLAKHRANWVSIFVAAAYMAAAFMKGYVLSPVYSNHHYGQVETVSE